MKNAQPPQPAQVRTGRQAQADNSSTYIYRSIDAGREAICLCRQESCHLPLSGFD